MKKKKVFSKILAIVLVLSLTLTTVPSFSVFAEETMTADKSEALRPEEELASLNTEGDLPLDVLETATLAEQDTPEIVLRDTIKEKGHVNRLWAQEKDLNSIVFQNRDGTKTAYHYSDPVKYIDNDGKVKDKKNTLIETATGEYTNAENDINAYFPKKIHKNKGVELRFGGYTIEMTPNINGSSGASRQTGHDKNNNQTECVVYPDVFSNGISVRYTPTFGGYKEDIILSENVGMSRFEFKLVTNGLSLVRAASGIYYLAEPLTGEYIAALGNVEVYDNTGSKSEGYFHYYKVTTISADEIYLVTVIVDEQYLASEKTEYPVYVDPTLEVMAKGRVEDAAIYSSGIPFANDNLEVKIGYNSSYGIGRGLYDFPIANFKYDFIHMYGNQIVSAELNLYATTYGSDYASYNEAKTLSLYEYNSNWSPSTVKWNNTSPNNYSTLVSSKSVTTGWTAFDILPVIEQFKSNPDYTMAFKGLLLKANSETNATWKKFVSSSGITSQRPYITITYNDNPSACAQVVSGATYYLKNYSSKYLSVYNAGTTDNTRLLTYAFNGNTNQQFKITNVNGGEYEIAPQHTTGKVLSVNSSGQVIIEEDGNLSRQRWYIFYRNGSYHIVNKLYNSGVMASTYNTDYVSINNDYAFCCWELERLTILDNFSNTEQELEQLVEDINALLNSYLQEISPPRYCNGVEITASNKSSYNCQGENIYLFLYNWYTEHIWPYEKQLPSWSYSAQQNEEATKRAALDEWSEAVYGETTWESIINSFDNYVNVLYYEIVDIQETLGSAFIQVVGGNYANEVTITGTTGQIILSFFGIDIVADVRDITYDITHWEWTWSHAGQTAVDLVALAPVIGALKNIDDLSVLFKRIDAISDIAKNADELQSLTSKIDEMILLAKQTDRFEEVANDTELWVKVASRNNDSNVVMLGKYFENADGTEAVDSYRKIAEAKGYAHYSMSTTTYNELKKVRTDGMFSINEQYLEIKISEGKTFYFNVDPNDLDNKTGDFARELEYLQANNYSFSKTVNSSGFYYAIKEGG